MEPAVIRNYLKYLDPIIGAAYIHTLTQGHGTGFNDDAVTFDGIKQYLAMHGLVPVPGIDCREEIVLLKKVRSLCVSECFIGR